MLFNLPVMREPEYYERTVNR